MDNNTRWIDQLKQRRLARPFASLLEAAEPLAPLGAQVLWVMQPAAGIFGWRSACGQLAQLLETPAGLAALRRALTDEDSASDHKRES